MTRVIDAAGSPYQVGYSVGSQAGDLVQQAVDVICRVEIDVDELSVRLAAVERQIAEVFPHVLSEADGLADGAGISRRDALLLSVVSDVTGRLPSMCSLAGVQGQRGMLLAKNLDTGLGMQPLQTVQRLSPSNGLRFIHLVTAGGLWTDGGVNEAGLALVNASLRAATTDVDGIPDGVLAREVLRTCHDVNEAVAFVERHYVRSFGENIVVADARGRTALISKLPGGNEVAICNSVIACNHVTGPGLDDLMASDDPLRDNSELRLVRLRELVANPRVWATDDLAHLLSDHQGGICQHGTDDLWSVAGIIIEANTRTIWVSPGLPCETQFEAHALESLVE